MQPSNPRALRPPQRWLRHTLKHHATEGRKVFPDLSWQCLTSPSELTRVYLFLLPHASSASSSSASSLLASCLTSSKTSASRFLLLLVAFWALLPLASSSSLLAPNFRSCFLLQFAPSFSTFCGGACCVYLLTRSPLPSAGVGRYLGAWLSQLLRPTN